MTTTVVQTRLSTDVVKALDMRAREAGITRAEVLRDLCEAALAVPITTALATDPLLDRICDELGTLLATVDAILQCGQTAAAQAAAAHAAAKLGALMLLPADRQQAYVEKLAATVQR